MVGTFGTMAADALHVAAGIPYVASTLLSALALASVFILWRISEHTLSFHSIDSTRRELLYWAAVIATFAMGTALGDLTAATLSLGYAASALLFAGVILAVAGAYRVLRWNAVFCFWCAYVTTRPLGASIADWFGKPMRIGGRGFGDGPVSLVLAVMMVVVVVWIACSLRGGASAGDTRR
jgi:uncharacterized membrane-anchored protein